MADFVIRPLGHAYQDWAREVMQTHWGGSEIVSRGRVLQADRLPGLVACRGESPLGLATFRLDVPSCELVTLASTIEEAGVGTALIGAVAEHARACGCRRLWLITTNDNTHALSFYQRRGFRLTAVHPGAVEEARRTLKPSIPKIGYQGIPIRDEIELELEL